MLTIWTIQIQIKCRLLFWSQPVLDKIRIVILVQIFVQIWNRFNNLKEEVYHSEFLLLYHDPNKQIFLQKISFFKGLCNLILESCNHIGNPQFEESAKTFKIITFYISPIAKAIKWNKHVEPNRCYYLYLKIKSFLFTLWRGD